jgi:hypothetical protein
VFVVKVSSIVFKTGLTLGFKERATLCGDRNSVSQAKLGISCKENDFTWQGLTTHQYRVLE